jgi:hypothetical protein
MPGEQRSDFGVAEARRIHAAGWRQGSIFRPPADFPVPLEFDRDREMLVVCTQSCTVVSERINTDPHIEFLVAGPVKKYSQRSHEATGKNLRQFHLPISGLPGTKALACDINRRFFVDRRECIRRSPEGGVTASEEGVRNFAGWIARYYTRIALPNELVTRAKVNDGLFENIQKALHAERSPGHELFAAVDRIGINWSPDSDLQGGLYQVDLLFLCTDVDAEDQLHSLLDDSLSPFIRNDGHDGIKLVWDTSVRTTTFISAFDGYRRFTEWDHLSDLGDVAEDDG